MSNLFFIVNQTAGSGRTSKGFSQVEALLNERRIPYSFKYTEYEGHGFTLAKEAYENGERSIIAVGGDGTAKEVGGALVNTDAVFGLLPLGTGNDLARALSLPASPEEALDIILQENVKSMDVGSVNDHAFLNVSGFGFDVDVLKNTTAFKDRFNGMLPYVLGIVKALFTLKGTKIKLTYDKGTFIQDALLVAVCNGTHFGGGMNVAPRADLFDGLFDVCLIRKVNRLQFIRLLPKFIKGRHEDISSIVTVFRTDELTVESERGYTLNLDGELQSKTPAHFKIQKSALKVFAPKK